MIFWWLFVLNFSYEFRVPQGGTLGIFKISKIIFFKKNFDRHQKSPNGGKCVKKCVWGDVGSIWVIFDQFRGVCIVTNWWFYLSCIKGVTLGSPESRKMLIFSIVTKSHQMIGNASKSAWELILDRFEGFWISFEVFVWSPIGGSI